MEKRPALLLAVLIGVLCVSLAAAAEVPDQVKAIADHFFSALKVKDYKDATKDFGEKMLEFLPPDKMKENQEKNIDPVIGDYVSHEYKSVEEKNGFLVYHYLAKFTKDEVDVSITFAKDDQNYRITGLWFNSPKLRAAEAGSGIPVASLNKVVHGVSTVADRFTKAIKSKNFTAATKDFGPEMKKALPPLKMKVDYERDIGPVIGDFVSREFQSLSVEGNHIIAVYLARFTKEDKVKVKLAFKVGDPKFQITGLWYDSPKLREAQDKK